MEPNEKQRELIRNLFGIYLVDAGAGTGKTFTLTRRYANILDSTDADPRDILLITFTNNAAREMKERIINHVDDPNVNSLDLQEAPISTFHALCQRILQRDGFKAPQLLGLDERITTSTRLVENEVTEREEFGAFWRGFVDDHPEHEPFYHVIRDEHSLLNLMKSLSAKGIFPTAGGWYQSGREYLDGNFEAFKALFDEANEPNEGKNGFKQSDLRDRLGGLSDRKTYLPEAPSADELREGHPSIDESWARRAFDDDRSGLRAFVHDLYWGYVRFSLERNYLNFSSLMMFAYVLLCESEEVRRRHRHRFVMVDEFQDTSEIQFKLAMLLAETNNLCVVGDWKQSIYSFQYASVKNIQDFEQRLKQYRGELNRDTKRIPYPVDVEDPIQLETNYRSTQTVLDFAERSLFQEATRNEKLDVEDLEEQIVGLIADRDNDLTGVEALRSEDEPEAVLELVQEIVEDPEYCLEEDGEERSVSYEDIAVLSRTRKFGLDLQQKAEHYNIPVAYEGGVELFKTNPSILLLAWLRVLDDPLSVEGWSVILERADYSLAEIESIIPEAERAEELHRPVIRTEEEEANERHLIEEEFELPESMREFRDDLLESESVVETARLVFDRYNLRGGFADKIIEVLDDVFTGRYANRGDMVQFIEQNIESATTYEVDNTLEADTVTVQTIHAAKGLEYPVVILADMNRDRFPGTSRSAPAVDYLDPVGLRQRKIYRDHDTPFSYDNWRTDLITKCLAGGYDEERRLLYVALTRAEQYLFLTADSERPGTFFEGMIEDVPVREVDDPSPDSMSARPADRIDLEVERPDDRAPGKRSVHDLMDLESDDDEKEGGRGKEFGKSVHEFAERYVTNRSPDLDSSDENTDKQNLKEFLDGLTGNKRAEVPCTLPVTVDDRRITIKGEIDLIHETDEAVEIVDYKTDVDSARQEEYRKQLSVYYHAVKGHFDDDRPVSIALFYTKDGERVTLDPLSREEIKGLIDQD